MDNAHRAPLMVLVFILEPLKPIVQRLADLRFTLGAYGSALTSSALAWRKRAAASTPALPLSEIARLATQMAKGGSLPG